MVFRTYDKPVLLKPARAGANIDTKVAEEDVLQGQVVKPGGTDSEQVEPSDTDGERATGVALHDAASGDTVEIVRKGYVRLTSGTGNISADDRLASHGASGEEGEVAAAASGDHVLGFADQDDVGDGDDVVAYVDFVESGPVYGGAP
jgi:hypothetical protein